VRLSRRALLQLALAQASIQAWGSSSGATGGHTSAALVVCDGRWAQSREFAALSGRAVVDVAQEQLHGWRRMRAWSGQGPVVGLTLWSEYLQVRGLLESRGLRLRREMRSGSLIHWELA